MKKPKLYLVTLPFHSGIGIISYIQPLRILKNAEHALCGSSLNFTETFLPYVNIYPKSVRLHIRNMVRVLGVIIYVI